MATSTQCRTVTLTDEPEENDAFSGPHQRIADALAGLIQPADAKGISIGVEGSWGSGKSTVARLLTRKLDNDKNIATVSFDAWAHEGDPLRRTFLEAIINELKDRGWTRTDWQETIDKLARRLEEVTTKDKLSIKPWGRVLAFTLLLIPIGGAFINAALREDITLHKWKFIILLAIGLILSFAPFLILLLKIKDESNLLSLFLNKGPTEKTTITNRTANPTSIEFEEQFNKLLEEVLKDNQKRIVLILDNLDRVDAKDALSIWSTLQTFFQHKGTKRALWHERLWLLVLYDLNGLSQLWEGSDGKTAVSFIDKSFQVRFEVPALVTSDWRKFLMDQLARAFPDHSESDLHEVYRVLATHVALINQRLTIRELKLFVNQIGAIHKQWAAGAERASDAFPLALIAYYVLLRRTGTNVVNALFNAEFPGKAYEELLGDTARENLAAIVFNVEVDVARQLLFSDKIKNALTLGSADELKKVASLLRRGFWEVLEQTAKEWATNETVKVADAAIALDESGLFTNAFQPSVRAVTKALCDRARAVGSWAPLDQRRAAGIAVILKWKNELQGSANHKEDFARALFSAIAEGLKEHAREFDEGKAAKEWLESLTLVTAGLESPVRETMLTTVVEKVAEQCHSTELEPQRQLCLEVLFELEKFTEISTTVEKQLQDFAERDGIHRTLIAGTAKNDTASAFMLYTLLRYSSDFKGLVVESGEVDISGFVNGPMVRTFVDLLQRHRQVPFLFTWLKAAPRLEPLVAASLRLVLGTPAGKDLFVGPDKLERLEFAFRNSQNSPDEVATLTKLIAELQTQGDLLSELRAGIFKADNAALYLLALRSSSGEQKDFVSWCVAGLRSASPDIWGYEFDMKGPLFSLCFELKSRGADLQIGEKYRLFLADVITSSSHTEVVGFPGENLVALVGAPKSASRVLLQRDLEARLRDIAAVLPNWFFSVFGLELSTMVLDSEPAQSVELLEIIFKRTELVALEWLRDLLAQHGSKLKTKYATEPAWNRLKESLRQVLTIHVLDPTAHALTKSIADTLNLNLNWPRNGAIAFAVYGEGRIWWMKDGLEPEVLFEGTSSSDHLFSQLNWSRDGVKLAYIRSPKSEPGASSAILVFDIVSKTHTLIASGKGLSHPSWSPDGRVLAFVREEGEQQDLYLIDVLTRQQRKLTSDGREKGRADWSANGRLAFSRDASDFLRQICVMDSDGSNERVVYNGTGAFDPSWSRDGKRIVFARWLTDTRSGLYVIDDASEPVQLIAEKEAHLPVWSPDGRKLLFQTGLREEARIYQVDADGRNQKLLMNGIDPSWQPLIEDGSEETTSSSEPPAELSAS